MSDKVSTVGMIVKKCAWTTFVNVCLCCRYHDMPDVIDFLVLRQQFDNARKRQWSIGLSVLPFLTDLLNTVCRICNEYQIYDKYI